MTLNILGRTDGRCTIPTLEARALGLDPEGVVFRVRVCQFWIKLSATVNNKFISGRDNKLIIHTNIGPRKIQTEGENI